jgi:hypothetical protein
MRLIHFLRMKYRLFTFGIFLIFYCSGLSAVVQTCVTTQAAIGKSVSGHERLSYSTGDVSPSHHFEQNVVVLRRWGKGNETQDAYVEAAIQRSNEINAELSTSVSTEQIWRHTVAWRKSFSQTMAERFPRVWFENPFSVGYDRTWPDAIPIDSHPISQWNDHEALTLASPGTRLSYYTPLSGDPILLNTVSKRDEGVRVEFPGGRSSADVVKDALARLDHLRHHPENLTAGEQRQEFLHAARGLYACMPLTKGSASTVDTFLRGFYLHQFNRKMPFIDGMDLKAMAIAEEPFYQLMIEKYKL